MFPDRDSRSFAFVVFLVAADVVVAKYFPSAVSESLFSCTSLSDKGHGPYPIPMKTTTLHVPSCTRFRLHFRYLAALLLAPALLLAADAKEDEPEPDFKSNSFRIRINHYTPATAAELERIGKDEPVEVSLNKPCTMEDFESICKHTWIEELKIENGNEHIGSIAPVASLTKLRSFIIHKNQISRQVQQLNIS